MSCFWFSRRPVYPLSAPPVAAAPAGRTPPLYLKRSLSELPVELLTEAVYALPFDIEVSTASGQVFSTTPHGHPSNPVGTIRLRSGAVLTYGPMPAASQSDGRSCLPSHDYRPTPIPATESAAEKFMCIAGVSSPSDGTPGSRHFLLHPRI